MMSSTCRRAPSSPFAITTASRSSSGQSFGRYLAEVFLIPQNEMTLAIPVDRLSESALRRFFPRPDETRVRRGMAPDGSPVEGGYNSCFWYPRVGGIARLVRGLARGIDRMHLSTGVASLNLPERRFETLKVLKPAGMSCYQACRSSRCAGYRAT